VPRKSGIKKAEEEKMKQLTLRIPHDLHMALKLKCVKEGKTMGEVLKQAIKDYVETV
jgi:predicted HicB family RNase H-like nuclease